MKKIILPIFCIAMAFGATSAFAEDTFLEKAKIVKEKNIALKKKIKEDKDFIIIQDGEGGNFSFAPDPKLPKEYVLNKFEKMKSQSTSYDLDGYKEKAYGTGKYYVGMNTTATHSGNGTIFDETLAFNGSSYEVWNTSGTPSKIQSKEIWTVGYNGGYITFAGAPSGSFTWNNGVATLQHLDLDNNWFYQHQYDGITAKAWNIYSVAQSHQSSFLVSNTTFTIETYDSTSIN